MKNLIAIIIVCSVWALPVKVQAQLNDEKMDKDLRVASKVLETLSHGEGEEGRLMMYGGDNVEGNYIEGYGVIFSISGRTLFMAPRVAYSYGSRSGGVTVTVPRAEVEEKVKAEAKASAEARAKAEVKAKDKENQKDLEIDFESIMVEFLADYSQMIGQLKPTDKIVVSTKKSDYIFVTTDEDEIINTAGGSGMSAELLKKDHNDFISGKISHDQLVAKIKVTKNDEEGSRSKDLDMFGSMLSTIYNESYTETYFMSWKPEYERIKGVGAIYAFKVFSSYEEKGGYRMPGINKEDLTDEARNENVEKLYPLFVSGMKENIIQYGRTIKSLEADELLLLRVTLTKCDDCSIPKRIQFSVKHSVLADFNSGKISLKEATAKVKLSEL
jgi:predicted  nucleic acid-binding Zn-ribbon protein